MIVPTTHPALSSILPYQQEAPVDVLKIAKEVFGINVWADNLGNGISGKLFRDQVNGGSSGFSIVVAFGDAHNRQRFTIAHELAHFVLHRQQMTIFGGEITDDTFYRSQHMSNAQETEANRFAADVLMPYSLIQRLMDRGITEVSQLSRMLMVSEAAMKIRLGIPVP